ncbi:MCE family protein [Nocardia sp. NBC_00565]|uniref:MCE family protein n=1 Tax=Nocardia sp. NBC_00565 TaxID=2975993 RepID=UPI002E801CE0|nr:MCE family protein [Nocardia sp. NBC_00565]WUC01924.1 MCE family protein [Nocardia sp. NBC_00565]
MRVFSRTTKLVLLFALVAVVAAAGGPVLLEHDTIRVTARFDSAAGLFVGNAVAVLGMRVGKVAEITQKGAFAEVDMTVDASVPIAADATAVIVSDSVLTDRHVEFTPPYRSGPTLRDGATLGLDHTRTPVEFDSLLAMVHKLSNALNGDGAGHGPIADMVGTGAAVTSGHGADMRGALDQLSRALRMGDNQGAATRNAITTIVDNLNSLTGAAARNDRDIREFGAGVGQLSDLLADQNLGTGNTGAQLVQILSQTSDLLQKYRGTMKSTVSGADTVMGSLSDYQHEIAEFLDVFPMLTDNAYAAVDQKVGAGRVHVNVDRLLLDGQMVKDVCNLLDMKQLGCNTGKLSDMGPDFGVVAMLAGIAELPK